MKKKKIILLILAGIFAFANGYCAQVDLNARPLNGDPEGGNSPTRSPILIPTVDQEDHTFYLEQYSQDMIVQILSGGVIVYSVIVPAGTTQIQLPESLQGDYEFDLIRGNYCFYGDITL
jgi:hypothetical protein